MCGLVCVVGKYSNGFTSKEADVFSQLLFIDMLRGEDSTGAFGVSNEGDVYGIKEASNSVNFMGTDEYDKFIKRSVRHGSVMVGHNRKATRGTINDKNAHPFVVDNNIVLVHNGTMYSDHKKLADVDVDSHAIAHLIHEKGDVEEALGAFHGAYALIWYDVRQATLHMVRNAERPLWWMETKDAWVWSSEPEMLDFVRSRENLTLKSDISMLPVDMLQTYQLRDKQWYCFNSELKIKRAPSIVSQPTHGGCFGHFTDDEMAAWDNYMASPRRGLDCAYEGGSRGTVRNFPEIKQNHSTGNRGLNIGAGKEPTEETDNHERERDMASKSGRLVTYAEWRDLNKKEYAYNTKVFCTPFDFAYVNGTDDLAGFYLYANPFGDRDVIIRHYIPRTAASVDRLIQLATGNFTYEMTLGTRRWAPIHLKFGTPCEDLTDETKGYCIFRSTFAQLLYDGVDNKMMTH